jgi:hypothetical protein
VVGLEQVRWRGRRREKAIRGCTWFQAGCGNFQRAEFISVLGICVRAICVKSFLPHFARFRNGYLTELQRLALG